MYGLVIIQLYLNTNLLENKLYRIIYVALILIYVIVLYFGMNNRMKEDKAVNDFDRNICYTIKENIQSYEKKSNYKIEKLKVSLEVTFLYKESENVALQQSDILISVPIGTLLKFYCGLDLDIEYISKNLKEFEKNMEFYYVENIAYLYINI